MRDMVRSPLAVTLVLALLGLLILEQVARWQEPPLVALDELGDHEGRTVVVQGIVTHTRPLDAGGWQLELSEGTRRVMVFAPGLERTPFKGDHVEAVGKVEWYRNGWELNCQSGHVGVLKSASQGDITLGELARAPQAYTGSELVLQGEVIGPLAISDKGVTFLLASLDGQHGLNVSIAPSLVGALPPLTPNERVTIQGELEFHAPRFHNRLRLHDEDHGIWLRLTEAPAEQGL